MRTDKVDDEAAVGAAARVVAKVGHAVGETGDDDVAGVGERVAEVEQGIVALG